jgi:serine protease Do
MAYKKVQFLSLTLLIAVSVTAGMFLATGLNLTPPASANQAPEASAREIPPAYSLPNFADIAEKANPAVVSITSTAMVNSSRGRSLFQQWFGLEPDQEPREREGQEGDPNERRREDSGGSGFIISEDGYILTNYHVVEDADRVEVTLADENRDHRAEVVGTDPVTDLALLKIDVDQRLPTIPLGDSDKVRVGEWVVAIGNPLAWDHTVTVGVISAKGRRLFGGGRDSSFDDFIQTDAAINFGNSGGPLLNLYGEAIGINTAISRTGQGIGFTIPINMAKEIVDQLKEHGRVSRGYLGIEIQDIGAMEPEQREWFGLQEEQGAFVNRVTPGFPAEVAGVKKGDAVIAVDGKPIESSSELISQITARSPGETADLTVLRNGEKIQLTAHLVDRDDMNSNPTAPAESYREEPVDTEDLLGFTVAAITRDSARFYSLEAGTEGVVATSVDPLSEAYDKGMREGIVILEVNRNPISSLADFRREVGSLREGDLVNFYIQGGSFSRFLVLRVGEN